MKSTVVDESLSSNKTNVLFQRILQDFRLIQQYEKPTSNYKIVLLTKSWILPMFYTWFEGIIVNCTWWGKMSQSSWRSVLCLKIWHMPVIYWTSKVKVIDQLLLCVLLFCSILNLLLYAVSNLSLVAEVMYISASPGFWMIFPMILVQGLPVTSTVAYINSPAM